MSEPLVQIKNLKKYFPIMGGILFRRQVAAVHAVDNVSLDVYQGECLGLVGESGCGKTTLGRTSLLLLEPTSGEIVFDGEEITSLEKNELRRFRKNFQIVFQDPYASLNPRLTVGSTVSEALEIHKIGDTREEREARVSELLELVGLASHHAFRYPHELSGGQRQRVGIARAIAVEPKYIVLDEPVSALDVSIRAAILNLLMDLQARFNLTYLFIAHDLSVIRHICDRVIIMYLGQIAEMGTITQVFDNPVHPYTRALLSAIPVPDPDVERDRILLTGDVPTPINPAPGCRFYQRCWLRRDECKTLKYELSPIAKESGHQTACPFWESHD
ncbi:MAG: ABC transporter ATP-binding protein [Candidatus Kariarchaeaceae archaeon]